MKHVELLAPAGDLDRAKTAIRYGADAVYIGGQSFSLRSRASNFTDADIAEACAFARDYGASVHVTVNIIPHEDDLEGLERYLRFLQECGVKAVIAASPTVMRLARECAPEVEVHCSTQLSVTNAAAAEFLYRELGIDRVVLARECTLDDVKAITAASPVPTEAFIHGGMCVNYSGRCTLSNRMTLRDANRGGCAQSCRWMYHLYEGDNEITEEGRLLTMGSKDLCAADEIQGLLEAGVSSFKIEGRMKTEYYVASVVSAYRRLIDELEAGKIPDESRMAYHRKEILKGENRAVCDGFYKGCAGADSLITRANSDADVNHDFLGRVQSFENGTAVILSRNPIRVNEQIEVLSPGKENRVFAPAWLMDENGEYMEECRRPMTALRMPVPFETAADDIFRRFG
ncbi:MAG: U32 family peptidase [Solobacterium sp.]|nr:U32 family peptidase [Solobacterium sp.]